jgi:hypothetical protein
MLKIHISRNYSILEISKMYIRLLLKKRHPFADTNNRDKTANHGQQEEGLVKIQIREWQRRLKERQAADGKRSDTAILPATASKSWDTIKQFHPYKKEIQNLVRIMHSIGISFNIIAATLGLQGWKTFYGGGEWTEEDVKDILEGYRA